MCINVCAGASRGQKRLDALELESWMTDLPGVCLNFPWVVSMVHTVLRIYVLFNLTFRENH